MPPSGTGALLCLLSHLHGLPLTSICTMAASGFQASVGSEMSRGVGHPVQSGRACVFCFRCRDHGLSSFSPPLEHLKKPVSELLMHTGESYRKIQEEREVIDRALPTQHDGKVRPLFPSSTQNARGDQCQLVSGYTVGKKIACLLPSSIKPLGS